MLAYAIYAVAALYLGVLTSISPCPLATNIAAISYISRRLASARQVVGAGLLYTLGRCLLYLVLAVLLASAALAMQPARRFLQQSMHLIVGPVLLAIGMILLGLIKLPIGGAAIGERTQRRIDAMGVWGALLLGVLFAVSFCPISAIWFFGLVAIMLGTESGEVNAVLDRIGITLPEAAPAGSVVLLPLVFGVGTALPVVAVSLLLAFSARSVGKAYNALARVEWWARMTTGWVLIYIGAGLSLIYVFQVR